MLAKLFAALVCITISSSALAHDHTASFPSPHQLHCLTEAVYHEARGEPIKGQAAVAHVVMKRTKFPKEFASTICGVVYQHGQFSWTPHEKLSWTRHKNSPVFLAVEGRCLVWMIEDQLGIPYVDAKVARATFFSSTRPRAHGLKLAEVIGHHRFFYNDSLLVSTL